jgi:hypothetical protein
LIADVERETSGCIGLPRAVDSALAKTYIGADDAFRGRIADKARHILSSPREFWNHSRGLNHEPLTTSSFKTRARW